MNRVSNQSVSEDDWISLLLIAVLVLASGAVSLGMFLDPLRAWMLKYHLLEQGETVAIPVVDGVGLGWGQILVILAILIGAIALIVWLKRRAAVRGGDQGPPVFVPRPLRSSGRDGHILPALPARGRVEPGGERPHARAPSPPRVSGAPYTP